MAKPQTRVAAPAPASQVTPETAPAASTVAAGNSVVNTATPAAQPARPVFKSVKILTLPLFKFVEGQPAYLRFDGKLFVGKKIVELDATGKDVSKEPPTMVHCTDMMSGALCEIMLGKVLEGLVRENYPDDGYIGRVFEITMGAKKRGRGAGSYNTYSLTEVEAA